MKRIFTMAIAGCGIMLMQVTGGSAQTTTMPQLPVTDPHVTPAVSGSNPVALGNGTQGGNDMGSLYNLNLFDGSANVSIPIYQYSCGAGNLGVSLGYNTKGITVDAVPSAIGTGWTLNAGGSITRVLKDIPDEWYDLSATPDTMALGKLYVLKGVHFPSGKKGVSDGESDDFYVSAGNLAFTFNVGKDGFVYSRPHTNARVQFTIDGAVVARLTDHPGAAYGSIGFKITDTHGNQYWFTDGDEQRKDLLSTKVTTSYAQVLYSYYFISRWVVSKVVLAQGGELDYVYDAGNTSGTPVYNNVVMVQNEQGSTGFPHRTGVSPADVVEKLSVLRSINYPDNITVGLEYGGDRCDNPGTPALEGITVGSRGNCIRYDLQHHYAISRGAGGGDSLAYGSPCIGLDAQGGPLQETYLYHRLVLDGIKLRSCDGASVEPYYSFGYGPVRLPLRLSGSQDYFGYFNGANSYRYGGDPFGWSTIPLYPAVPGIIGTDRTPDADSMQAGILTTVRNAYGGQVAFGYGAHQLSNAAIPGLPTDAYFLGKGANDGLCLKDVTVSDRLHPGNYKKTALTYSGGKRFLTGGYFNYVSWVDSSGAVKEHVFSGIYASPHQFINGSNHGYSTVTAEDRDQGGLLLSKRVVSFSNFSAGSLLRVGGTRKYFQPPFTDKQYIRDWEIGLPLSIVDYDQGGRIVSRTANHYHYTLDTTSGIGKFDNEHYLFAKYGAQDSFLHYRAIDSDTYRPYTGKAFLDRTANWKYVSDNVAVKDTLWYARQKVNGIIAILLLCISRKHGKTNNGSD